MDVIFETEERWSDRGGITFWAYANGEQVRCIVSREAIEASFGGDGTKEASLELFSENRLSFEAEAAALIRSGRTVAVPGETFHEAQIVETRIRHRPVAAPTRRVVEDEFAQQRDRQLRRRQEMVERGRASRTGTDHHTHQRGQRSLCRHRF